MVTFFIHPGTYPGVVRGDTHHGIGMLPRVVREDTYHGIIGWYVGAHTTDSKGGAWRHAPRNGNASRGGT